MYFKFFEPVKRLLLATILLVLTCWISGSAQDSDSLHSVVARTTGLEKYHALIELTRSQASTNYNDALQTVEEAQSLALELGDSASIVQSGRMKGQLLNYLERTGEAYFVLIEVLPIAKRHNYLEDYKKILDNLAIVYTIQAEYDKALNSYFQVLALHEEARDELNIGFTYNNIGLLYYKIRNFNEALGYYLKALKIQQASKEHYDLERLLANIGYCYNNLNDFEKGREMFLEARAMCRDNCREQSIIHVDFGLALSFYGLNQFDEAERNLNHAYEIAVRTDNKRFVAETMIYLGKIAIKKKKYDEAAANLYTVQRIAMEEDYKEILIDCYRQLSIVYENVNNHISAADYLKKYVALKDSTFNEQLLDKLAKAKANYEQRENLAIIKAKEMTIAQQKRLTTAVIVIALLAGLLVVVLLRSNKAVKSINTKLSKAQDVIYQQNKQLEIKNEELDRLVEKKTEELKLVNLSLKQMNDELDTFINKTAQDIRSPLASLKGICNVALMDIKDEASLIYLRRINNTTELLSSILKRLLAISQINHSKISVTEIDLKTLVDSVISVQRKKGLPDNIVVRKNIVDNTIIHSDKELVSIVIENSIDNSLKFCTNSVRDEHFIEINVTPGKNGRVNVSVIDNGLDLSKASDSLATIFHGSGFDLDPSEAEKQDLYFVKTAAKKIGGKVNMKKTPEGYNELSVVF
jgi:signal transduction histidine kinase